MLEARWQTALLVTITLGLGCSSDKPSKTATPSASDVASKAAATDSQFAGKPAPTEIEAPSEPSAAEIDALVKIASADGFQAMGPQEELWTALFQLKSWHLMTFPDSKSTPPGLNIETHEGKKWIMAFTDSERLYEYAKLRNQLDADGTMIGMSVPSQTSFEFFEGLAGIEGVRFNQGDHGFFAPMGNLRAIHSHLRKLGRLPARPPTPGSNP